MRLEYKTIHNGSIASVIIDTTKAILKLDDEEQILDVSSKDCFNTLISLFALKEKWEFNTSRDCVYTVIFNNKKDTETYSFSVNSLPDNWNVFLLYISRLVGEFHV
jgi:hypothetical protein